MNGMSVGIIKSRRAPLPGARILDSLYLRLMLPETHSRTGPVITATAGGSRRDCIPVAPFPLGQALIKVIKGLYVSSGFGAEKAKTGKTTFGSSKV